MIIIGILLFALVTLLPGLLAVRLLRRDALHPLNALLYAVGLGLVFNILVGSVANFTYGMALLPVVVVYVSMLVSLGILSYVFGENPRLEWFGWKPIGIPIFLYVLAVGLQLQTTLMSPNLVGSDIHLEYFVSNMVLEQGLWNPMYMGTTLNACLGLTMLLPIYKLLTGLELLWVYKLICPMIFAVLPVVLYRIFRMQFSAVVSVLAVGFFITMPMFTMDMVQLVRQQQSELFFVLAVLVLMDGNLNIVRKLMLGSIFAAGVMVTHLGIAIGFIGYLLAGFVVTIVMGRLWKNKVDDAMKPLMPRIVLAGMAILFVGLYAGYYGWVSTGKMITSATIPIAIVERTAKQVLGNVDTDAEIEACVQSSFFQRFPFLNPFNKEPLAQTAIGLDFGKASALGRVWRVLQYLVELCLIVGFFKLLFKPNREVKVEYMSFVIASLFVLVGMYLLCNYGWGLGAVRVWGITLLFMSPLFAIGCGTIGGWLTRLRVDNRLVGFSTLALLVPYFVFNSGLVFEVAKLEPVSFIDVPYSIALSGRRVDLASIFTENDVEAMDWLKETFMADTDYRMVFADTHGGNLVVQRIGTYIQAGEFKYLWEMKDGDKGYIFLREWNVDNGKLTVYGDYGGKQSYAVGNYEVLRKKIEDGSVVFDNGARVILSE